MTPTTFPLPSDTPTDSDTDLQSVTDTGTVTGDKLGIIIGFGLIRFTAKGLFLSKRLFLSESGRQDLFLKYAVSHPLPNSAFRKNFMTATGAETLPVVWTAVSGASGKYGPRSASTTVELVLGLLELELELEFIFEVIVVGAGGREELGLVLCSIEADAEVGEHTDGRTQDVLMGEVIAETVAVVGAVVVGEVLILSETVAVAVPVIVVVVVAVVLTLLPALVVAVAVAVVILLAAVVAVAVGERGTVRLPQDGDRVTEFEGGKVEERVGERVEDNNGDLGDIFADCAGEARESKYKLILSVKSVTCTRTDGQKDWRK